MPKIIPIEFSGSPTPTLGVEWEFALTDKAVSYTHLTLPTNREV